MSFGGFKSSSHGTGYRWVKCFLFLTAVIITVVALPGKVSAGTDDYPTKWKNIPIDSTLDDWGMYNRECTSFVAWRLAARNSFNMPFHANASQWVNVAKAMGYPVDSTPAVGAVASSGNHVAWVEAVSGDTVTVEEYNNADSNQNGIYGDDGTYGRRMVPSNSFSSYIHFRDISSSSGGVNGLSFRGSERLGPSEILRSGQYILSPNSQYVTVLQGDGNLVLYGNGFKALWNSQTAGSGAVYAAMQGDGNLVLYRSNWTAVWASNTAGRGTSSLHVQDDGNLVTYTSNRVASWNTGSGGQQTFSFVGSDRLASDQVLKLNQYIRSADKRYAVLLRPDGNLVAYSPGQRVLWVSGTAGRSVSYAAMQSDGNLVLYTAANRPVWDSKTAGSGLSFSVIQSDGNFVVYTYGGRATWNTETNGRL